jgi:alkaline phosphatase
MKFFLPMLVLSFLNAPYSSATSPQSNRDQREITEHQIITKNSQPKNIIMVIGDGMGPAYTSAYRYFSDDPSTVLVEETVFDRHLIGLSSTYPDSVSGVVTDSAAGATALASGTKTYNGAIGLDVNKNRVESVLEFAKKQGKKNRGGCNISNQSCNSRFLFNP